MRLRSLKSSWMNIAVLVDVEDVRSAQEAARAAVDVAEQQRRQTGAAGVVDRIVDEVAAEGELLRVLVVRERRRHAQHPAVAELQLVTAADLHERVLELVVHLLRVHRQERRPAGEAGVVVDVDVGQARRDLVDVDALDAERRRRLGAVVGLGRERQRPRVAEAELVDEAGADDLRVVEGQAMRRQARVLDAGDERARGRSGPPPAPASADSRPPGPAARRA